MPTDSADTDTTPVCSFQSYAAEGDLLAKQLDHLKAIDTYTKVFCLTQALALKPKDKHVLVCRARCHLALGLAHPALTDANQALQVDPLFFKVL